jgi:hypothetical protein
MHRQVRMSIGLRASTALLLAGVNLGGCGLPAERVGAAGAEFISSHLLRDGRLFLSLMADGGVYGWESDTEPAGVPFGTEPDAELEKAILEASPDYTREMVGIGGQSGRYLWGRVDLNDDGREEVFVYLLGSIFCGTGGCNLLLFQDDDEKGYSLINSFPISRLPVIVSAEKNAGWRNLIRLESGGGAPSSYLTHTFDGTRYVEQERVAAETVPEGTRYLVGEFTFADGIPLEPRD